MSQRIDGSEQFCLRIALTLFETGRHLIEALHQAGLHAIDLSFERSQRVLRFIIHLRSFAPRCALTSDFTGKNAWCYFVFSSPRNQ
ncbi:hypothetical protein SBA4_6420004 [Candidatus Sulfopaludibacter sp. SbA4]|nr:hypothetical protein SBA4_6420004 [Candidatus Sulfopaludibacter sp. SbA4]